MTGGAFGSLFAQFFHLSPAERKTLLVSGAAAGMSAVFATPVAAVLLAVELLLFEWKPRSFIPVALSAAVASVVRVPLLGAGPIFAVAPHGAPSTSVLALAIPVGILAGFASGLLTLLVYAFEDLFGKLPIHWMWWPAIGGLFVGLGGLWNPAVLGVGYDTIHALLRGHVAGASLVSLMIGKSLVWSIALGSGTSGGVLAPLLMMGGALGALAAPLLPGGDAGLWATLGMAAIMGGTMRSPLTAMIFTAELTHDWNLLPALLVTCVAAQAVTVLMLRRSILTEKVARRGHHLVREYSVDPFEIHRVREVMDSDVATIPAEMTVDELSHRIARGDRTSDPPPGNPHRRRRRRSRRHHHAQRPHARRRNGSGSVALGARGRDLGPDRRLSRRAPAAKPWTGCCATTSGVSPSSIGTTPSASSATSDARASWPRAFGSTRKRTCASGVSTSRTLARDLRPWRGGAYRITL